MSSTTPRSVGGPTTPRPRSLHRRLATAVGIDRAIAYTIAQRGWSLLAAPVTLLFISRYLSAEEQGFYYTFASVLGLQSVFELGFSFVLLQVTSHEMARLQWRPDGTIDGDPAAKARLASLMRLVVFWYAVVAALVVAAVLPAGLLFFSRQASAVRWHGPWVWVVLASAMTLSMSPVFAMLEGTGLIAEIALQRTIQGVLGSLMLWLALSAGWGLFAAPLLTTVGVMCGAGWLAGWKRRYLLDLLRAGRGAPPIQWREEIWPFQWRIAVSTLSSYLIFQLYNPLLFVFQGPVAAGRMGMSMTIMTAISGTALAWVSTKSAPFGALIARRDFVTLDRVFFASLWQSLAAIALGGACFWIGAFVMQRLQVPFSRRLLPPEPLALLIATGVVNHIVSSEALYLRAHKREPFLGLSVAVAALVAASSFALVPRFGATGMTAASLAVTLTVGLGLGTWIFNEKRRAWHDGDSSAALGPLSGRPPSEGVG